MTANEVHVKDVKCMIRCQMPLLTKNLHHRATVDCSPVVVSLGNNQKISGNVAGAGGAGGAATSSSSVCYPEG